jgi:hypothetical protein
MSFIQSIFETGLRLLIAAMLFGAVAVYLLIRQAFVEIGEADASSMRRHEIFSRVFKGRPDLCPQLAVNGKARAAFMIATRLRQVFFGMWLLGVLLVAGNATLRALLAG